MFSRTCVTILKAAAVVAGLLTAVVRGAEEEPPALNPFGPVRQDRDDAVPGYVEMSDGTIYAGNVYMTRDKRLKVWDASMERQREIPLRVVAQIECKVEKEWIEREWKFKELALDEKMYTGKKYPSRVYTHTVTLRDGRKLTGPLAEILYVRPFADSEGKLDASQLETKKLLIHKRDKGETGMQLKDLLYVKTVKLGKEAYEEGKAKAEKNAAKAKSTVKGKKTVAKPAEEIDAEKPVEKDADAPAGKPKGKPSDDE